MDGTGLNATGSGQRFGERTHASNKRASRECHASIARADVSNATMPSSF